MNQPLVSLIIVCHNQWKYTDKCLKSIFKNTNYLNYEIIVIDNGSTDNTVKNLKEFKNIQIIANPDNQGYTKANNQGILSSRGQYVVLLNNDLIVPKGWLTKFVELAEADPKIGLMSSRENFGIKHQNYWPGFIWFTKLLDLILQRKKTITTDNVFGFCLFIRRELLDKIGLLDQFAVHGDFTDQDLCLRTQQAGYKVLIARDIFIYHYHAKTFNTWAAWKSGISRKKHEPIYRKYFAEKWAKLKND